LVSVSAFSEDVCIAKYGSLKCWHGVVSSKLEGTYGKASLNSVIVKQPVGDLTAGRISAANSTFKNDVRFIAGRISLNRVKAVNHVNLTAGSITASNTHFLKPIDLHSESIKLRSTQVSGDMTVHFSDKGKVATLVLKDKSYIQGDVKFVGNKGRVCIKAGSKISGQIINAIQQCDGILF
jgi:hypothetical protein